MEARLKPMLTDVQWLHYQQWQQNLLRLETVSEQEHQLDARYSARMVFWEEQKPNV